MNQRRASGRDLIEPLQFGDRRADHLVAAGVVVEPAAEPDDTRLIDVEPHDRRRWGEPEEAAVEAATEVQHNGIRLPGKVIRAPVVELPGP